VPTEIIAGNRTTDDGVFVQTLTQKADLPYIGPGNTVQNLTFTLTVEQPEEDTFVEYVL
jgi:hypothetical protein